MSSLPLSGCENEPVVLPAKRSSDRPRPRRDARARVVFVAGRRHVVHIWTAPRSPAARALVAPLLVLATLLVLAVGLVVLVTLVAAALVAAAFFLLLAVCAAAVTGRSRSRRPPS
jgi:hypothetical protein